MKARTRAEAVTRGASLYHTGVPCPRGHLSGRRVSNRECKECYRERKSAARKARVEAKAGRPRPTACEICGDSTKTLCFDHCHAAGHFRGWLCGNCNKALGFSKDNPEVLDKLAQYLRDNQP